MEFFQRQRFFMLFNNPSCSVTKLNEYFFVALNVTPFVANFSFLPALKERIQRVLRPCEQTTYR